jgi:hypothetical protein
VPALQKFPTVQSAVEVQLERQAVGPHPYAPQVFDAGLHAPAPSHVLTSFSMPPLHDGVPHATVVAAYLQVFPSDPSQRRPHPGSVGVVLQAGCEPTGAPTIGTHLPTEPT